VKLWHGGINLLIERSLRNNFVTLIIFESKFHKIFSPFFSKKWQKKEIKFIHFWKDSNLSLNQKFLTKFFYFFFLSFEVFPSLSNKNEEFKGIIYLLKISMSKLLAVGFMVTD